MNREKLSIQFKELGAQIKRAYCENILIIRRPDGQTSVNFKDQVSNTKFTTTHPSLASAINYFADLGNHVEGVN